MLRYGSILAYRRRGWKDSLGTNTLAYFASLAVTKIFYIPVPWGKLYKDFYDRNLQMFLTAKVFVPGRPFLPSLIFVGKTRSQCYKT